MIKNKNILIIIGAVVVVVILIVVGFFVFSKKPTQPVAVKQSQAEDATVHELSAEDIGLELAASPDSKKIQITINKLSGIKAVTYELTYEADSTAEEKGEGGDPRIQRGITGDAKFKAGDSKYQSPWLDLGSCSKSICRYDAGVTSVDLLLKITKDDNKIYSSEKKLDL